ncbi:hypothetical protein MPLDJ20_10066 [Mesorhizobium plurifarium]|uniref:Uncharacterized protein n=1 Tax=Mesorhizobium plurifarium TaxID=69974 RepID=A0A090DBW3_MESPL|nr:hypothetical protein MPLDJ20_10066 [Mesorhizobium plurifarium]
MYRRSCETLNRSGASARRAPIAAWSNQYCSRFSSLCSLSTMQPRISFVKFSELCLHCGTGRGAKNRELRGRDAALWKFSSETFLRRKSYIRKC